MYTNICLVYKETVTHTEKVLNKNGADNIENEEKRSEL